MPPSSLPYSKKYGVSVVQVIINWATRHGVSVLPISTNAQWQKDNLNSFGFQLSDEEMLAIDNLDGKAPRFVFRFVFRDEDGSIKGEHVVHRGNGQEQRHVVHGEL